MANIPALVSGSVVDTADMRVENTLQQNKSVYVPAASEVLCQRSIGGDASHCFPIHRPGEDARTGDSDTRAVVAKGVLEVGLESADEKGEDRAPPDVQLGPRAEVGLGSVAAQGFQTEVHSRGGESERLHPVHCFRFAAVSATDSAVRH